MKFDRNTSTESQMVAHQLNFHSILLLFSSLVFHVRGRQVRKAFVPRNENYILLARKNKDENTNVAYKKEFESIVAKMSKTLHSAYVKNIEGE